MNDTDLTIHGIKKLVRKYLNIIIKRNLCKYQYMSSKVINSSKIGIYGSRVPAVIDVGDLIATVPIKDLKTFDEFFNMFMLSFIRRAKEKREKIEEADNKMVKLVSEAINAGSISGFSIAKLF